MSIIYDALQKTQHNRTTQSSEPLPKTPAAKMIAKQWPKKRISVLMILFALSLLFLFFSNKSPSTSPSQTTLALNTKAVHNLPRKNIHLTLNGVFLSDQLKVAMINNQTYKVGDKINNFKVMSIQANRVQLQSANQKITLRTYV
ncbi:MAG: hypothetical protein JO149_05800 [Gammaproteobacteria bacterium]|nr:hypothetical protein [Gammaproteobacteria bacterium]